MSAEIKLVARDAAADVSNAVIAVMAHANKNTNEIIGNIRQTLNHPLLWMVVALMQAYVMHLSFFAVITSLVIVGCIYTVSLGLQGLPPPLQAAVNRAGGFSAVAREEGSTFDYRLIASEELVVLFQNTHRTPLRGGWSSDTTPLTVFRLKHTTDRTRILEDCWYPVGFVATPAFTRVYPERVLVVKGQLGKDIAYPLRFECIYKDTGSGGQPDFAVWRPVPPEGFVTLGDVCSVTNSHMEPNVLDTEVMCVNEKLCYRATVTDPRPLWTDRGAGTVMDCSMWRVPGCYTFFSVPSNQLSSRPATVWALTM